VWTIPSGTSEGQQKENSQDKRELHSRISELGIVLKAYRKRIGLEDDRTCETCAIEEEDREHLLGKCPAWSQERRETFGKTFLSDRKLMKAEPADIIAFLWQIGRLPANDSA